MGYRNIAEDMCDLAKNIVCRHHQLHVQGFKLCQNMYLILYVIFVHTNNEMKVNGWRLLNFTSIDYVKLPQSRKNDC